MGVTKVANLSAITFPCSAARAKVQSDKKTNAAAIETPTYFLIFFSPFLMHSPVSLLHQTLNRIYIDTGIRQVMQGVKVLLSLVYCVHACQFGEKIYPERCDHNRADAADEDSRHSAEPRGCQS